MIQETRSRAKMKLENAGHSTAVSRATSYFSATAYYNELTGGTAYYHFLEQLEKDYAAKKGEIIARLQEVSKKLFTRANMLVNYTADDKGYEKLPETLKLLADQLPQGNGEKYAFTHPVKNLNEGLKTSAQVDYVARCGNFRDAGLQYTGALKILQVILSYDYLWLNIRVKGGAYGCMSGFYRNGDTYMVSYRDPNLAETNTIFEQAAEYVRRFDVSERDMVKFIIGTIGGMDTPMNPASKGVRSFGAYICHTEYAQLKKEREEVLNATKESIRALAPLIETAVSQDYLCVVGNNAKIRENEQMFEKIEPLFL